MRSKVSFIAEGVRCAGYLYLPADPGPAPCVVLCHGFSGTMDRLFDYGERFAAAGFAALVFDYRSFGESDGEPRQVPDIQGQLADVRAAVAFVRGHERVDPGKVLLWGNSLGGAHVITVAAGDPRVAAVVAQIPFNGFPKKVEGRSAAETLKVLGAIYWDALRGGLGLRPYYIPMVGRPGELAVTATPEADQHIQTLTGGEERTSWRNSVAPRGLLQMMRYHPAESAARLACPLLVCVAAEDRETPLESTRELAERAPRGELRVYPGTHFTFYTDPTFRDRVVADQVAFFRRACAMV
ncbi:alpha/beta hydrolase [Nonomuraea gerenzanensis]|uniref:Alpha/beta hydrolase fold n=1 Tax=Nonomuraea gerenzanensis TaxID=93944 RepID=A0A1M4E5P0_9ACTN|nr:alpha/beta fold hydrolase [Nonomuraea gerenzanensis]UBU16340.1 alpha/beta hydrolase [Nonomuraea gerenzanensis]SBO94159.1 alpha/beta hydrolase fold [Nonomuraea gerenzanensis]